VAKSGRARLGRGHHGPEREYGLAAQGGGMRPATEGAPHGQGDGARGGQGGGAAWPRGQCARPGQHEFMQRASGVGAHGVRV